MGKSRRKTPIPADALEMAAFCIFRHTCSGVYNNEDFKSHWIRISEEDKKGASGTRKYYLELAKKYINEYNA